MSSVKLSQIMTNRVITVNSQTPMIEAIQKMADKYIGSVIVLDKRQIMGILTERDILRILALGNRIGDKVASQLMTPNVIYSDPETNLFEAADILIKNKFRRLPVVHNDSLVGIVTISDLIFELENPHVGGIIKDYISRELYTVGKDTNLKSAVLMMVEKNIGSLLIEEAGEITGILTEGDVVRKVVAKRKKCSELTVDEIKSKEMVTIDQNTQISHVCHLMHYYGYRRFPVVDDTERIIGMLSSRDLLHSLRENY